VLFAFYLMLSNTAAEYQIPSVPNGRYSLVMRALLPALPARQPGCKVA
jgi:hypothetical protein